MNKKVFKIFLWTAFISLSTTCSAFAGQWKTDATGWWYQTEGDNYLRSKWLQDGGKWYYFYDSGYMATGWINDSGKWYYLGGDGAMFANTTTPDGYRVGADGAWTKSEEKKEALKAYAEFLSKKKREFKGIDIRFTTVYIDEDDIPELLIFTEYDLDKVGPENEDLYIYTYYQGKVVSTVVSKYDDNLLGDTLSYYWDSDDSYLKIYEKQNVYEFYLPTPAGWSETRFYEIKEGKENILLDTDIVYWSDELIKYYIYKKGRNGGTEVSKSVYNQTINDLLKNRNIIGEPRNILRSEALPINENNIQKLLNMN